MSCVDGKLTSFAPIRPKVKPGLAVTIGGTYNLAEFGLCSGFASSYPFLLL